MRWIGAGIQLHNGDYQTADWIAKTGSPAARARIRRWSRVETIGVYAAIAGIALLLIASVVTLVVAVRFSVAGVDRTDVYWWIWGIAAGVPLVAAVVVTVGGRRRLDACFADGYLPTGRVDRVTECPGGGDDTTTYAGPPLLGGGSTWRCAS